MKVTPITEDKVREHFEETNEEPHQVERMLGYASCNHIHYYDEGKKYYSKTRTICEGTDDHGEGSVKVLVCDVCKTILVELPNETNTFHQMATFHGTPHQVALFHGIDHEKHALINDGHEEMYSSEEKE